MKNKGYYHLCCKGKKTKAHSLHELSNAFEVVNGIASILSQGILTSKSLSLHSAMLLCIHRDIPDCASHSLRFPVKVPPGTPLAHPS